MPEPTKIPRPFADSGDKNTIPESSGALGFASWQEGFPAITGTPFAQGGVAPKRADFNGIFNALSLATLWQQQGGFYAYDATTDYEVGNVVLYSGDLYKCLSANGPSSAVKAPTDTTVWSKISTAATLAGYLPLSGGTITGNLQFATSSFRYVSMTTDTFGIAIYGGSTVSNGSSLVLWGKDGSSAGHFYLRARDANNSTELAGTPAGALTWGSKAVETVSQVQDAVIDYTSGLSIRTGRFNVTSNPATITFDKAFPSGAIPRVICTALASSSTHYIAKVDNVSTTGFNVYCVNSSGYTTGATFTYVAVAIEV